MGEGTTTRPEVATWVERVRGGTRSDLARAITLVESSRADHRELTQELLVQLAPYAGKATRIGISGVPGVGKSTFIDGFGSMLTARGHRVAVLAVDPSSTRTGGSILGDKTRMARLAVDPHAFVRPSPTGGRLGGVARATRETMVLVEAAGYDVVLVETVGVGQSEVAVADMVDTFLLLALGRTGDQLQAIKKGILELADVIAVNKADGQGAIEAGVTARDLTGAMRMMRSADPAVSSWRVPVLTCSGLTGAGLEDVWDAVQQHHQAVSESGSLQERRSRQHVEWMWSLVSDQLLAALHAHPAVRAVLPGTEAQVRRGELTAASAAQRLLDAFLGDRAPPAEARPARSAPPAAQRLRPQRLRRSGRADPLPGRRLLCWGLLQLDEEHVGGGLAGVLAGVALGRQPGRRTGLQLDVPVLVSLVEPSPERAEGVHHAVGVIVRGRAVARLVGVLQHPHAVVLEDHRVVVGVAHHGIQAHPASVLGRRPAVLPHTAQPMLAPQPPRPRASASQPQPRKPAGPARPLLPDLGVVPPAAPQTCRSCTATPARPGGPAPGCGPPPEPPRPARAGHLVVTAGPLALPGQPGQNHQVWPLATGRTSSFAGSARAEPPGLATCPRQDH